MEKIPWLGGKTYEALFLADFAALMLDGAYNPIDWLAAWFAGLDALRRSSVCPYLAVFTRRYKMSWARWNPC